ncbi:mannitol dehydrogenase family protein [Pectinatus haikarae]|uniref:mannitol dehydrogenase family protein n=1 Tax=Pectinatus haikarae TaxID=349096 RepID=UPI001E4C5622|nr:mannitol dehydrogenase family protein [Pectinatus haikarae]
MLQLNRKNVAAYREQWEDAGIKTYNFSDSEVIEKTESKPQWLHFGGGNIFRAFIARLQQELLERNLAATGIIVATTHNKEVITKLYRPYDNLSVAVTMHANGDFTKKIIGNITEALVCDSAEEDDWQRLKEIIAAPSLQIVSFTITEKAYKLKDHNGNYFEDAAEDMKKGPENPQSPMGCITSLLYTRYKGGGQPIAFLSLDNCSHNGDKIKEAVLHFAETWEKNKLICSGFSAYINDKNKVAFPWSMIDKITPQPSEKVRIHLKKCGFKNADAIHTEKSECSLFVNAEKTEYLVIEDKFPNGRPPLEKAGVIFTDKDTVDKIEHMKVCTCLNPLHTALAVYGCLLGYTLIADEMKDVELKKFIELIGYKEGLPVVTDPKVLNPKKFIDEVIKERFNNPNVPDTPQRIASDTSQKVGIRFGETIKAHGKKAAELEYIPLAIAGWCRYLLGIDDAGNVFTPSPDPLLKYLQDNLTGIKVGEPDTAKGKLTEILSNKNIFGINLYEVDLGKKVEKYFGELISGKNAVRNVLKKYVR